MIGYLLLAGAVGCEVFGTTMMKVSNGFSQVLPTVACVAGYVACFWLLGKALTSIDLSIAYAMWAALGIVLTTVISVAAFGESLNVPMVLGMALIVVGVVVVNVFGAAH